MDIQDCYKTMRRQKKVSKHRNLYPKEKIEVLWTLR